MKNGRFNMFFNLWPFIIESSKVLGIGIAWDVFWLIIMKSGQLTFSLGENHDPVIYTDH